MVNTVSLDTLDNAMNVVNEFGGSTNNGSHNVMVGGRGSGGGVAATSPGASLGTRNVTLVPPPPNLLPDSFAGLVRDGHLSSLPIASLPEALVQITQPLSRQAVAMVGEALGGHSRHSSSSSLLEDDIEGQDFITLSPPLHHSHHHLTFTSPGRGQGAPGPGGPGGSHHLLTHPTHGHVRITSQPGQGT